MLPTGRDIEYMAEIRRARRREADHYRLIKTAENAPGQLKLQAPLGRLGQGLKKPLVENSEASVSGLPAPRLGESS
ncbi:MAG: hypothetical protein WBB65_02460 [Anaerolineales bacterium]